MRVAVKYRWQLPVEPASDADLLRHLLDAKGTRRPTCIQRLCHDLVHENGVTWQEWFRVALEHHGLEFTTVTEPRRTWVARHDGRNRKAWQHVQPPVPYIVEGGIEKKGLVKPGVGQRLRPVTLQLLFRDFVRNQAIDLHGDSIVIDDQTGLPHLRFTWTSLIDNPVLPDDHSVPLLHITFRARVFSRYTRGDGASRAQRTAVKVGVVPHVTAFAFGICLKIRQPLTLEPAGNTHT